MAQHVRPVGTAYAVSVGDRHYRVEVRDSQLMVDGERVDIELTSLNGNGLHLLRQGVRTTEIYLKTLGQGDWEVTIHGRAVAAQVDVASRRRQLAGTRKAAGDIRAPMPGLVVDVHVVSGQVVSEGDVLLVQESMKMQMLLRAPFNGRVESVQVRPGVQVEKGMRLVLLTTEANSGLAAGQASDPAQ